MSREREARTLKDLLDQFVDEGRLKKGMKQMRVKDAWADVMGAGVVSYTQNIAFRNGILYVGLTSSVLRAELSMGKQKIMQMLNEHVGSNAIQDIILK